MSSPALFIFFPAVAGLALYFLRRWFRLTATISVAIASLLAGLAWFVPLGVRVDLGAWLFRLPDRFLILGRRLVLANEDRLLLWMIFAMTAFWLGGVVVQRAGNATAPLGLMLAAFWVAALAVEPLLYAALLVELAVLVSIPILIQPRLPGVVIDRALIMGGLRFLALQTLGMACFLIAGWTLAGVETMPSQEVAWRAASLVLFGLFLLLGVFPFHAWISLLAEKSHPYTAGFILVVFLWMGQLLGLRFLDRYVWFSQIGAISVFFQLAGSLAILAGGVSAAFERSLGRIMGYAILVDTGFGLLALGLPQSRWLILAGLMPRLVSFGVLCFSMGVFQNRLSGLALPKLRGIGIRMPWVSLALVLALLSIVGLPTLAYFPIRMAFLNQLASLSAGLTWVSLAGEAGLLAATVRLGLTLVSESEAQVEMAPLNWQEWILTGVAILLLFGVGLLPHGFIPLFVQGLQAFQNLAP